MVYTRVKSVYERKIWMLVERGRKRSKQSMRDIGGNMPRLSVGLAQRQGSECENRFQNVEIWRVYQKRQKLRRLRSRWTLLLLFENHAPNLSKIVKTIANTAIVVRIAYLNRLDGASRGSDCWLGLQLNHLKQGVHTQR